MIAGETKKKKNEEENKRWTERKKKEEGRRREKRIANTGGCTFQETERKDLKLEKLMQGYSYVASNEERERAAKSFSTRTPGLRRRSGKTGDFQENIH